MLAENYLQHAEHYTRIIMAYRDQLGQPGEYANGNGQRMPGEVGDEFGDDEGEDMLDDGFQPPQVLQHQPQARHEGNNRHDRDGNNRNDRPFRRDQGGFRARDRNDRGDRGERGDRGDRYDRGDRERGDRERGDRDRQADARPPLPERAPPPERASEPAAEAGNEPRRRDRFQQPHEQPDFLRRPVRRSRSESTETPPAKDEPSRD